MHRGRYNLLTSLHFLSASLARRADFQMLFPIEAAVYGGRMPASFNFEGEGRVVKEWIEKVHAR
jgi:hypothetical protein